MKVRRSRARASAVVLAACTALLPSCAVRPEWQQDFTAALSSARRDGRDLVVYFALPGRDASDRMQARLGDEVVIDALQAGGFDAVVVDGVARSRLYGEWIGGGEGMGIAVLDGDGDCYAARPGPQDPPELAARLRQCAEVRPELARLRRAHLASPQDPLAAYELGCLYLELGCRVHCEPLLVTAAMAGVSDARHRLARYYALDGNLGPARRWLKSAPKTADSVSTLLMWWTLSATMLT